MNEENFGYRIVHSTLILIGLPLLIILLVIYFMPHSAPVAVSPHEASAIADVSIAAINAVAASNTVAVSSPPAGVPWWIVGLAIVGIAGYKALQAHHHDRVALAQAGRSVQPVLPSNASQPPAPAPQLTLEQLLAMAYQYGFERRYNRAGDWILVSSATGQRLTAGDFAAMIEDGGEHGIVRSEYEC